ncbi:fungal-specific transcription factor domain-containing protein [Macrophomina phaseolina]|uniref:Fungal-specific transcription factor domain-containing protein n=1 Tax=Macrophomina phaseolina TaxID=35725 RepID=A0ABQ8FSU9_9PEZI|nr:fungal-specific transcription factor domain-containing protein [Macrophomina phaseolina]
MSVDANTIDQLLRAHSNGSSDRVSKPSPPTHSNSISSASGSSALNPRSCVTCRRRKVKCDKKHPCTNCTKARIECIFPAPGRAPRKARKPPDAELLERLRKLEGMVKTLGGAAIDEGKAQESEEESPPEPQPPKSEPKVFVGVKPPRNHKEEDCGKHAGYLPPEDKTLAGLETRFGRLVVDEGRSRYINSSFWASLNNEVEDIRELLTHSDDEAEDHASPDSVTSSGHQGFLFGYSSTSVDMLSLHPPEHHLHKIWTLFKENVDPLVKVLHIPTVEPKIMSAIDNRDHIPRGMEALLFSIYYAVITSTSAEDCHSSFSESKEILLSKYRFGVEQALARANFLETDEFVVLQAFVIFLICLRRNEAARIIWTLTGLVVRMAQTLGIHRDGSHFGLSPFEVEMRRRLWWQVCILDSRASEDHGCDPTIIEASFDTQIPLNVNDTDLTPDMADFPPERTGCTEMTFCLVRYEVANVYRRIQYVPPGPIRCNRYFSSVSLEQKERWITEVHSKIEEKYLRDCDMTVPLYWVIATVSRLIMSKMWLMIYHPYQRLDGGASLPQETKDKLFVTSLENIEYSILLETEGRTQKWGWLFRTYVQWHAIAFLLSELCHRTRGDLVARAWRAVEATAARRWNDLNSDQKKGCLWRPLRKLVSRARAAREAELLKERQEFLKAQASTQQSFPDFSGQPMGMDLFPQIAAIQQQQQQTRLGSTAFGGDLNVSPSTSQPLGMDFSTAEASPQVFMTPSGPRSLQTQVPGVDLLSPTSQLFINAQSLRTSSPPQESMKSLDWLLKTSPEPIDNNDGLPSLGNSNNASSNSASNPGSGSGNTPNSNTNTTFANINTSLPANGAAPVRTNSASTLSPGLGDPDGMNWASWDDLVAQYGMDVDPIQGLQGDSTGTEQLFVPVRGFETWY